MQVQIFVNDQLYKTVDVASTESGGYDAVALFAAVEADRLAGLLGPGPIAVRLQPV